MSFFKKTSGQLPFEYILIAKIKNMMVNAAPALNVLHYMKPRVCAYVNINLCRSLGLIDANYADAMTTRFRVSYSNNTGYVELSDYIEFRCKEEEEEAKSFRERPLKKSTKVQTEPTESSRTSKRTLPRALSSISNIAELPWYPHSYYPTYPSPNSVIASVLDHKTEIVSVGQNYLLVLDNRGEEQHLQDKELQQQLKETVPEDQLAGTISVPFYSEENRNEVSQWETDLRLTQT
uniref:DUF7153 domain-containing protein n=1 Tax=Caenorhabditis japonica TaxID=281687 RepID=A0A8R1IA87_CAEJA